MVAVLCLAACVAAPAARAADAPTLLADDTPPPPDATVLYLQVRLNGNDTGRIARFLMQDGRLSASAETLRQLGFTLAGHAVPDIVPLDALPGLQVRYDAALQRVALDAPLSMLDLGTTRLGTPESAAVDAAASPGMLLNYDFYGTRQDHADSLSTVAELRLFGFGVLSNTAAARVYRNDTGEGGDGDARWRAESVRLETSWKFSFPDSAIGVTLGDSYSGSLAWTRPVRLGGVRVGRDFSLQPYRVTTPLPAFLGDAVVPSTVDLYVNGMRQYSGEVPPGPFQLTTVPGITGTGSAQIVVTDAFGRTRTLDFPFYSTQQLLAKGLSDWSVAIGTVRHDYGVRSFEYGGEPVASASLRRGVNDHFTLEAHGEGGNGLANLGIGGLWLADGAGVVGFSHARSSSGGRHGSQTSASYDWNSGRFNLSLQTQRTHGDYLDIGALDGAPAPDISDRALVGLALPRLGNLSASYVRLRYPGMYDNRYAGLFWSRTFSRRWSANLSFNQNLDEASDRSAYFSISIALDGRRQADLSWQRSNGRNDYVVGLAEPVPGDGDRGGLGWRVQARDGDAGSGGLAEIGLLGPAGRYAAGVASLDGNRYGYASATGSLAWLGGHVFAARSIDDAFAVVSTNGVAGVPVELENRPIGNTDRSGMLLVTPLLAWQRNRLSIDPMDLPADVRIDDVERIVVPRDRSGIGVRFGITPVRAAVIVLHDAAGRPLPVGSEVRVEGQPATKASVGYDGETYLDTLDARTRLRVSTPGGACSVDVAYPSGAGAIPRIGPLTCKQDPP